jgi:rhomboid protease GluP
VGAAARAGGAPPASEVDPALAAQIARTLPAVAQLTVSAKSLSPDLLAFRHALYTATPRLIVTPVLTLACVAVFVAMVAKGAPVFWPSGAQLTGWGANDGRRVVLHHEFWRLFTSVFVHGGIIHLALNMSSLLVIGPLIERLYGNIAFGVLYLAAGIGGAIASMMVSPVRVSVGASGALFGVLGALLAFLSTHRHSIPKSVLKPLGANALGIVIFMAILGSVVPNIDQAAHLGGLATGFVSGFLLSRPWPAVFSRRVAIRRIAMSALIALALAGTAVAAAHRAETTIPPGVRLDDLLAQIRPSRQELAAIEKEIPTTVAVEGDREDPSSRANDSRLIRALIERGKASMARLKRADTPDPRLKAMIAALIQTQSHQLARLEAAGRYLDTGNLEDLTGPSGALAEKFQSQNAFRHSQEELERFLSKHGPGVQRTTPKP